MAYRTHPSSGAGMVVGTTAVTGGGSGRVLYIDSSGLLAASADLTWDNTNKRIGGASSSYFELGSNIVLHKGDGRDLSMIGGGVIASGTTYTQLAGRFLPGTASVASATNMTLPLASVVRVTGTTQIDYWGDTSALSQWTPYDIHFAGALTLLHNGGSAPANHVPFFSDTGANLAIGAGECIRVIYDGSFIRHVRGA